MSLQQWLENSRIVRADPSKVEAADLLGLVDRDIADGSLEKISLDGRFEHAYSAMRTLCQLALHAEGYRVRKDQGHKRVIESLKYTLGPEWNDQADYFDICRRTRHRLMYDRADVVNQTDADELLESAKKLRKDVIAWLRSNHGYLVPQTLENE
ncbi:MAG: hypothetical protein IH987_01015 [Planctomycetes bacterium]|nr:hypothetical protein [Planctomycetota bacterium]